MKNHRCYNSRMAESQHPAAADHAANTQTPAKPAANPNAKIHRVCIGCNNMFEVTMENYEIKHCPVCRKE
ncbi:MAG TPA: hypothetical protein VJR26_11360 [Candidatus Acidoferrales bacterium]|nr:hypothetical protein [Candidatus Acidoferrales bacterium]